jgi:glycosyltransferase involved in cell wall biosynthesis
MPRVKDPTQKHKQSQTNLSKDRNSPAPIRVLMVVRLFYPWVGGTERQALKLAKMLVEKDVQVEIVTGWWFRGTPQREVVEGISVFRNHTLWEMFGIKGLRKLGGYLYILTLLWYLAHRRKHYDIIHVHGLNYHTFAAALAGRWFKRKTITKLANSGVASDITKMKTGQQLALSHLLLPVALTCDRFIALTKTIVNELVGAGVPPDRILELVNGIDTEEIVARSSYELHQPPRLIYIGRLHAQKGLDILLKAVGFLTEQELVDGFRLQLVGSGPLWNELHNLVDELGIGHHVQFLGQSDRVLELLQGSDIFILTSRAEGISNALLEAMTTGLPVIVSNVPGNMDVITHNKNGLLCSVEKPDSLSQAITTLLYSPDLRERLGKAARETIERRYDLGRIADRYIQLYRDLLSIGIIPSSPLLGDEKAQ